MLRLPRNPNQEVEKTHKTASSLRPSTMRVIEYRLVVVLTYFPAAHSEKEAHHIGLLLLLELFDILEGTHFGCWNDRGEPVSSDENGNRQFLKSRLSVSVSFKTEQNAIEIGEEGTTNRLRLCDSCRGLVVVV